ncbi:MAG: sulfite exporter TauE/SafE family protein [Clostridia bacterium]|nr:sulfite exporter TauE/SafE family protein [Clostridia bacterium]
MILICLFLITVLAYGVKAITGFGNTLVMASLFSFAVPNRLTTPIDLIFSLPTNAYMVCRERKSIKLKLILPISILLVAGAIPGTLILKGGNDCGLKAFLGIVIIGIGMEMLLRRPSQHLKTKSNPVLLMTIGIISGALAGMYGIGAPLVAYINRTTANHSEFRANLCCVFLVDNLFRLVYYSSVGLISWEVVKFSMILAPAAALGMCLGVKLDSKLKKDMVRMATIGLLIVSGFLLFINNILLH